jgi:hypothetical protein
MVTIALTWLLAREYERFTQVPLPENRVERQLQTIRFPGNFLQAFLPFNRSPL